MSATRRAACSSPTTTARRSRRCSRRTAARRSAPSRSIRRTRTSSTSAPVKPNNRQTSSFGDGIYKTEDGGKTFSNVGLKETQTIARIVIDPKSPDVVYVAAPGHLFGPSPDGGVYKTTDGGKSWNKIKYIDENTGFTDIVMDPSNSRVLYAASYQRRRSGCCYNGGGPGSALWKSDNAGQSWDRAHAATGCRVERSAASPSPCRSRIRTWSTRRSRREQRRRLRLRRAVPRLAGGPAQRVVGAEERAEVGPVGMTGATTPAPDTDSAEAAEDAAGAAPTRRTAHHPRSTPTARAFSDPTTRASRGRSSATATLVHSTSARSASIRATNRTSTSPACTWRSRSTAARRSCCSTTRAASSTWVRTSTRSGSIRRTATTSCAATMPASWSRGTRARRGSTCARWRRRCRTG